MSGGGTQRPADRPRVIVVGLGPAGPELLTHQALAAIDRTTVRFLRTARHPSAGAVPDAATFDHHYETAATFADVYHRIADDLVAAAGAHGEVLYAVPGSPRVLERSVAHLLTDDRVDVELVPSLSFLDLAWDRLAIDPVEAGVRLVDGHRFAAEAAGQTGPLLVAHVHDRWVCSDIKLSVDVAPTMPVVVLQRLGLADEAITEVEWADLDRGFEPDHLTALWIPELAEPVAAELQRFAELVEVLRQQCPWDRAQTHASLARHLLEECYETLDAIDGVDRTGVRGTLDESGQPVDDHADPDAAAAAYEHLEEELGDLLFQIGFHARIAAEQGAFTLADVARGIREKLVARHPHVFGDSSTDDAPWLAETWERAKRAEKGRASVMDGIPVTLPALLYATKVLGKAAAVGGMPVAGGALDEIGEPMTAGSLGDALLAIVAAARRHDLDAEAALRSATHRVVDAVRRAESDE